MRIAVIGIPGGWSSEALADAAAAATGGPRMLADLSRARLELGGGSGGRLVCALQDGAEADLSAVDAIFVKKVSAAYAPQMIDRLEMLRAATAAGVRVFSDPARILRLVDRLACSVTLAATGAPLPPTTVTEDFDRALDAVRSYGRAVLKPLFTSKARGMALLDAAELSPEALEAAVARFAAANPVLYIQQALDLRGQDLGVCFLGGEYLGTYARRRDGDAGWSTSTAAGGKYAPFDPPAEIIELARRAQEPFGLTFTCVDVALTPTGPYVFEVSAFGGFRGLLSARGMDVAARFTAHCLAELGR